MTPTPFPFPDLTGQTALVTGASGGIGAVVAHELAAHGARVVRAVRTPARLDPRDGGRADEVARLDLADLTSVRELADSWHGPIDLLVNNAAAYSQTLQRTADGFELQLGTNHLGHFALTALLLEHLRGRVVTVASQAERVARLDVEDLNWQHTGYRPSRAYNNSKLANLLFSSALQRRLEASGSGVTSVAAHPGLVRTSIYADYNPVGKLMVRILGQSPEAGALPVLYAAVGKIPGDSFVGPERLAHMRGGAELIGRSAAARDVDLQDRLWAASEQLTGISFPLSPMVTDG